MASIVKVEGKSGTSYRIFVTNGRTQDGGQVRHTKTWKVPAGMTEKKAEKEAKRIAYEFEEEIGKGILADNRQTLAEYSAYVFGLKERTGIKQSTLERYRELMRRITPALGHLKLREITPRHLNEFYANLAEEGIRDADQKATPKKDLKKLLKEKKLTLAALSRQTGMAASTFAPAVRGRTVSKRTADVLAEALGAKTESLFTLKHLSTVSLVAVPHFNKTVDCISENKCRVFNREFFGPWGLDDIEACGELVAVRPVNPILRVIWNMVFCRYLCVELVARPADGNDNLGIGLVVLELLAEVHDVVVDGARRGHVVGRVAPDVGEQVFAVFYIDGIPCLRVGVYEEGTVSAGGQCEQTDCQHEEHEARKEKAYIIISHDRFLLSCRRMWGAAWSPEYCICL